MKILILNDVGAPHGGAERLTLSLRDGLRERGHDARVFASSAASDSGPTEADYSCFGTTSALRTLNRVANPSAAVQLRRVLRDFAPDVVHVRMFLTQLSPLILPLLRDVPALYQAAWFEAVCPTGTKVLPDRSICSDTAGGACFRNGCLSARAWGPLMLQLHLWRRWRDAFDVIVASSGFVRARLLEAGIESVEMIWNGVPVVPQRPPLRDPPTITCAGRLIWEKGTDVVIRAFADVVQWCSDARLLIAGAGPEEKALHELIEELRLTGNVRLLGRLAQHEIEAEFAGGRVHVVPSLCPEGFGLTAAEASMRGTAVIGSRAGGIAEVIADRETGLLVPPGDVGALSAALRALLGNRELAEGMGRNGRARALRLLDRETWLDTFVELYKRLGRNGHAAEVPATWTPS